MTHLPATNNPCLACAYTGYNCRLLASPHARADCTVTCAVCPIGCALCVRCRLKQGVVPMLLGAAAALQYRNPQLMKLLLGMLQVRHGGVGGWGVTWQLLAGG